MRLARVFPLAAVCLLTFAARGRADDASSTARAATLDRIHAAFPAAFRDEGALIAKENAFVFSPKGRVDVVASAPLRADGALHVSNVAHVGAWIDVHPEGVASIEGVANRNAVTYPAAAPALDLVHFVHAGDAEEMRVLWSAAAPTVATWDVDVGPAIETVRAREGRFELLDAKGYAVLQTAPITAVDANGVERELALSVKKISSARYALEAALDAKGLAYPIVVDPLWTAIAAPPFTPDDNAYLLPLTATSKAALLEGSGKEAIYDPTSNTWTKVTSTSSPYDYVYAPYEGTMLRGSNAGFEQLDVANATWTLITNKITASSDGYRCNYAAEMPDKRVFVQPPRAQGELCDLAAGTCTGVGESVNTQTNARSFVAVLSQTAVFGVDGPGVDDTYSFQPAGTVLDVFNGANLSWTSPTNTGVAGGAAGAAHGSGYIFGGYAPRPGCSTPCTNPQFGDSTAASLRYDAGSTTGVSISAMPTPRGDAATATLPDDDHIFVVGGMSLIGSTSTTSTGTVVKAVEIFDAANNTWQVGASLTTARRKPFAVSIDATHVLVVGGTADVRQRGEYGWGGPSGGGGSATWLATGEILALPGPGGTCTGDTDCGGVLKCVDGVCCATNSCPAGQSCSASATNPGTCAGKLGSTCSSTSDCGSGFCVDGVCCDGACTDVCGACNLPGKEGTCSVVTGNPVGSRACAGGGASDPCASTCLGKDRANCGFSSTAVCGANACSDGTESHVSVCDGMGKCGDTPKKCAPYTCDTKTCKSSCSGDGDCANGFSCLSGVCVQSSSKCSSDGTSEISPSGDARSCAPYICSDGRCLDVCGSSADCVAGASCDSTSRACTNNGGGTGSSGGCAIGDAGASAAGGVFVFGALALLGLVTRRRR